MKIKEGFAMREICGDYVLIPVGENALNFSGMITTNEVGSSMWNFLCEEHTEQELFDHILEEYEVEEDLLKRDIANFLEQARKLNILIE